MRWLFRALGNMLLRAAGEPGRGVGEGPTGAAGSVGLEDREELIEALREHGGFRRHEVHSVGPPVSVDGLGWDADHLEYAEGLLQTEVDLRSLRRCDCGCVIAFGNSILGLCGVCGATLCARDGCSAGHGECCGALLCMRHAVRFRGHTFCSRHRGLLYWRAFWGVLG